MDKTTLRREIGARKRALTPEQIEAASARLAAQFFAHPLYRQCTALYAYLSYNQEVRTAPILRQARADGKRVAVPKITEGEMRFFWLTEETVIAEGFHGILEPQNGLPAHDPTALVLMPGLAFDASGNRMGYGGGYYDRFLAAEPQHPTVALCYDFQLLPSVLTQAHDIPVDAVLAAPV